MTANCCRNTLKLLDIERSRKVTDLGAEYILQCSKLKSLAIFNTAITSEGKAKLIIGLVNLEELPRGDFLCEAVEYIHEINPQFNSKLKIKGFWASEEYFFHSTDQLELVARLCPDIEKMLFMFNNQEAMFRDLIAFNNLKVTLFIYLDIINSFILECFINIY